MSGAKVRMRLENEIKVNNRTAAGFAPVYTLFALNLKPGFRLYIGIGVTGMSS